jgi:small subunit ribosomal protein S18
MAEFYKKRKKVCQLCAGRELNYKDVDNVRRYVDREKYKILPRRVTGTCARHQRDVAVEVKRARYMALIPYVG